MIGCFLVQLGGHHHGRPVRGYAVVDIENAALGLEARWSLSSSGYAFRQVGSRGAQRCIYLHRLVLGMDRSDPRKGDHINGNTLDCRRSNLRIVTSAQNSQNQPSIGRTSSYRGVSFESGRGLWRAQIRAGGICRLLGRFDNELDAAAAVRDAREEVMPFANEERHPLPPAAEQAADLERYFTETGQPQRVPREWPILTVDRVAVVA